MGLIILKKYGLEQKPIDKIYKGLYPEWSIENPVHLVGHSMGGQTARNASIFIRK